MKTTDAKPLLPITAVASALDLPLRTVRAAVRAGHLRGRKIGNRWRVEPEALRAWLATRENREVQP